KDNPFLIYFAINCPHYPYQGDTKWLEHYNAQGVPHPRNLYNAFVSTLDARIGKLIDHLEVLGIRDDTIIVFQSDHGHSTEERAHFGGGSAGPYRGAKFSLFEGGIRVPAIISWPGSLPEGKTSDAVAHSCDWLPTVAALAEIPLPRDLHLDGKNIAATIRDNAPSPHSALHWQVGSNPIKSQWAVRRGPWKLIGNPLDTTKDPAKKYPAPDAIFLSNLDSDPAESTNIAANHPEIVAELKKLHDSHLAIP
ncbi:MAG: sulfatase-like hydrolase/transferase, partial [Verrucomicrobiales bacterium]|nr:sulfatase-like hydrolase/transferase [Verrucomicrobiales bacterium]